MKSKCLLFVAPLAVFCGCSSTMPDRAVRMQRGYVYYLDGAGGGGMMSNWSGGVRDGLLAAGYDGAGEMYTWETGRGVVADQESSNEYKRGKAADVAGKIAAYRREHPTAPVTLMGLSAGTAVAAFALEALPPDVSVTNVVMLSGSLSSTHDLTRALSHVRGKCYVFTSQRDAVLQMLMPMSGTADRDSGTTATIGVEGPRLPPRASPQTRALYASKVVVIPWNPEFAAYGNLGGHTDTVKGPFVQHVVAPLVLTGGSAQVASAKPRGKNRVENPDYRRWAAFSPGAWVLFEGHQMVDGERQPIRVKVSLMSRNPNSLVVEREFVGIEGAADAPTLPRRMFVAATIDPGAHPMTHPATKTESRPSTRVTVGNRNLDCEVKEFSSSGDSPDWGRNARGTVWQNSSLPGGIARIEMTTQMNGRKLEFSGTAIDSSLRTDKSGA